MSRQIIVEFLGKDKSLGSTAGSVETKTSRIGKTLATIGKVGAAGFAAAGAAAVKFTADAAKLDEKQREVVSLFGETGPAAEKSLGQVRELTRQLSNEFGIAQETLTGGLYQAISAGVPRENALEFMRVASQAATAGVTDVETSVDGLTSIINAFGLEASDAQAVADSMFTTVKDGKTNFEQLSGSIYNIAPAAAAAGVSFQEVNAAIATMTAGGTPTAQATTQLRAALTGLQKPSSELTSIFQDLGYENAQAAIESKGLGFALDAVKTASKGNNGELMKLLGSSEAVAAANVLAGTGADKFTQSMKNQKDAAGATADAFEVMAEGPAQQWEKLKTRLTNVGLTIGQKLLPVALKLVTWANDEMFPAVRRLSDWFNANLRPSLEKVGEAVGRIFGGMSGDVKGPLNDVISIIRDTVSIVRSLWNRFGGTLTKYAVSTWKNIRQIIGGALKVISGVFQVFASLLKGDWRGAWEGVKKILQGAVEMMKGTIKQTLNIIRTLWRIGWSALKGIFGAVWDGIKSLARNGLDWIVSQVKAIPGRLRGLMGSFGSAGRAIIGAFVDGLKGAAGVVSGIAGNVWGALKGTLNDAISRINSALEFTIKVGPKSFTINPPDIPRLYARGTMHHTGGRAIVGEAGPELLDLPVGSRVYSASNTRDMLRTPAAGGVVEAIVKLELEGRIIERLLIRYTRHTGRPLQVRALGPA